ncbi:hypothetical protein [Arthrobacter sp. JSM 101049]|uniref:hypothetical protein n=1 Tax=Arthrobacter sp. JSM 101049 TaxID=929097 RepID=UPI003564279C
MSENPFAQPDAGEAVDPEDTETDAAKATRAQHDHDDERVDEWEEESFPASDPPSNY